MKTILTLTAVLILTASTIYSQVSEEWVKRHTSSGDNDDRVSDLVTDASGNVYVTGTIVSGFGDDNIYTIKYDPAGNVVWNKAFDGGAFQDDHGICIAVDASGNVYVCGSARQSDSTGNVYAAIKYNSAGTQQWARFTNVGGNTTPIDMKIDAAGNMYVTGSQLFFPYGKMITVKYNSSGTQQWLATYNPNAQTYYEGTRVEVDASGNVYIGGNFGSIQNGDMMLLKYNSSGVQQWVRTYTGGGTSGVGDLVNDMTLDAAGNIYLAGQVKGQTNSTGPDMVTLKYNSAGTLQWAQKYNGLANYSDIGKCIGIDGSGNVYIGGAATASGTVLDLCLIKYNSAGTQQWVRYINGTGNGIDYINDLILDASGNIFVTGQATGLGTGYNYITMRYNPAGTLIWTQNYIGPGNASDIANSIALGMNGVVYITGTSEGSGTGLDFATIKYGQTVGIQNINTEEPSEFSLGQNYPNPFNPVTNITFSLPNSANIKLTVFDIAGREIAQLVNGQLNAGTYNVDFDASHLASGTYFYKLETAGFTDIKKMILVK